MQRKESSTRGLPGGPVRRIAGAPAPAAAGTLLLSLVLAACQGRAPADPRAAPRDVVWQASFDERDDEVLTRWVADVPASSTADVRLSEGRRGNGLRLTTTQPLARAVKVSRMLDAVPLRGRRLRLSAYARVTSHDPGREELQIALVRPRDAASSWDLASGVVPRSGEWAQVAAVIDVPVDATSIDIAIVASGTTEVTFDDLRLDARDAPANSTEPLRADQRDRLIALGRLVGYLRFFYPGDAAAKADWAALEIDAVDRMMRVHDGAGAHRELAALARRIAPDAAVYPEGSPSPEIGSPVRDANAGAAARWTRWVHVGLGRGEPYWSFRTGLDEPKVVGMRVSRRSPLAEIGPCKRAVAQIAWEVLQGPLGVELEIAPIVGGARPPATTVAVDAQHSSVELDLPPGAHGVSFGAFVRGAGNIDLSGIQLSCDGRPVAEIRAGSPVLVTGTAHHLYTLTRERTCGRGTCLRIARPVESVDAAPPAARDRLDASIGAGLRLRMPLVAATDGARTLPAQPPPSVDTELPSSARAGRLAAVLDLWIMLRWFSPHFADLNIDRDAAIAPALDEAARAATNDEQRHAVSRLTVALRDGHARVLRPGVDDGLLPVLFRSFGDTVVVAATLSPPTDVPVGATLVSIDGVPAVEARRRASELMSASTPGFELRHSTYSLAYGRKGTFARLILREPGADHDVTRLVPRLDRAEMVPRLREPRPASGAALANGVIYVDLHTLDEATWTSILPKLTSATAIIFDLRGYVGPAAFVPLAHLSEREVRSPTFLLPVISPDGAQHDEPIVSYTAPRLPTLRAKALFLADARTASAPETILQIVRGERLGTIIGEPTGGANGNVIEYRVIGGMTMRFTGMRIRNHDGTLFQGHGVTPDIVVHPTIAGVTARRDEILEAAVALAVQGQAPRQPQP